MIEATGAGALATTSAGLTRSLGAAADRLDRDRTPAAVAVHVPVSADVEGGHPADPAGTRDTARAVLAAGADRGRAGGRRRGRRAAVRQRARRHLSARRRGSGPHSGAGRRLPLDRRGRRTRPGRPRPGAPGRARAAGEGTYGCD
ncbi:isocitrate lyase/phosphoenolpyruvate mutase family protein [Streptomyces murinus]|uniref:isocitrate lyase/phosphoenolpyruvate mutase family protein n=1 Tax=Streptomyces murinus TaxID=33900 RepID=UPI002E812303|nr:isocitrate lyase/phosphoenolpyruvate mutase family protein [Streptomyces murinus]